MPMPICRQSDSHAPKTSALQFGSFDSGLGIFIFTFQTALPLLSLSLSLSLSSLSMFNTASSSSLPSMAGAVNTIRSSGGGGLTSMVGLNPLTQQVHPPVSSRHAQPLMAPSSPSKGVKRSADESATAGIDRLKRQLQDSIDENRRSTTELKDLIREQNERAKAHDDNISLMLCKILGLCHASKPQEETLPSAKRQRTEEDAQATKAFADAAMEASRKRKEEQQEKKRQDDEQLLEKKRQEEEEKTRQQEEETRRQEEEEARKQEAEAAGEAEIG